MPERERDEQPDLPVDLPQGFGKYFLTEKLATGGMAEIYLAKIVGPGGFEKQLVIKQIHPKLTGQRHFVDLFVAEAKTLVTLTHGNIVPVYELGVIDDTYFIAMEYIDGPTLYRLTEALARREVRMDPAIAAWITARVLEGLDYAHRKGEGVIHRDLSPRNVMLSRDGEVKLVDFGIAVTLGDGGDTGDQSAPTGSFPYMSPEQVRKEPLNPQTDLFSVGVLLWEMLTGHRLFARTTADATLHAVVEGDIPRPSAQRPDIPDKLEEIVMRALERDMTSRWPSAGEMLAALRRYIYSLEETPGPRDVERLVARYCPPETRRLPTDLVVEIPLEPRAHDTDIGNTPPKAGPRTAVIPREGTARGKTRARTETFATNVQLEQMLERATPLFPIQAIRDQPEEREARGDATPRIEHAPTRPAEREDATRPRTQPGAQPRAERAPLELPGREPPSRSLLLIAAVLAAVLGVAAVVVFFRGRAAVERPDAAPRRDAPFYMAEFVDAAPDAPVDAEPDAELPDAPLRPHARDAGDLLPRIDAAVRPTGTATLKIGANPWGDVVIDGVRKGRTPIEPFSVPAGHHVVEVIFGGEDPPRTQRFPVDLANGDTKDVFADFTKP
jgi:eukaryotic-like serine/threonine-protein kinase